MTSNEIRTKFLEFFKSKGHAILPSASLIPQGDSSVLFTTAGMQPLVPYLLGEKHPSGTRLASVQKCLRTGDIDDIGDNRHLTFFEMLGNWSLGDYFKDESIGWSYEFLTDKNIGLGLDPTSLYITCFKGDDNAPRDTESADIWMKAGIPENRIYFLGKEDNWWGPGDNGPCGPDTEIFYDVTGNCGELSHDEFLQAQKDEKVIEIWNNVFMEYKSSIKEEYIQEHWQLKLDNKPIPQHFFIYEPLPQKNVDTGMGLERITAVVNGLDNVYETDLFFGEKTKEERIVTDHIKAALFLIAEGILPSNTGQGYILRRLIRRAARFSKSPLSETIEKVRKIYSGVYDLDDKSEINKEETKFRETLEKGLSVLGRELVAREVSEIGKYPIVNATPINGFIPLVPLHITGDWLFKFYSTFGFPFELAIEELQKDYPNRKAKRFQPYELERIKNEFREATKEHQKLSQTSSAGMFKGGIANHNEATIKLHTAHHLLLAALQSVLGSEVKQRGSNITEERLRIDFSFDRKMTDEEKKKVEDIINNAITRDLKVVRREMTKDEAEKLGAQMEFGAKYGDTVSVYFIEDENGHAFSKEFCGGPHVEHTGVLGKFKIQKEEASSAGVRRIKAVLE